MLNNKGGSHIVVSCCRYHQFIEFGFGARAENPARAENNICTNEPSYNRGCAGAHPVTEAP